MNLRGAMAAVSSLVLVVAFQNCSSNKVSFDQTNSSSASAIGGGPLSPPSVVPMPAPATPKKNCSIDATKTVLHGNFSIFYRYKPGTTICDSMQVRVCNDGILSGSADYVQSSCSPATSFIMGQDPSTLAKCSLGNMTVEQGGVLLAFKESQPSAGSSCVAEFRECGSSGLSGSFTAAYCQVKPTSSPAPAAAAAAAAARCAKWSTSDGSSVCIPEGAMALGFPEQLKAADGKYNLNYVYATKNQSTGTIDLSSGSANSVSSSVPAARWTRERTVFDPAVAAYFTVSQSAKSTSLAFSYNAYDSKIEMCRIQIEVLLNGQSVWMDSSGKAFACSHLIARAYDFIGSSTLSSSNSGTDSYASPILNYNLNGARVRIVNHANNEAIAIAEKRLEF